MRFASRSTATTTPCWPLHGPSTTPTLSPLTMDQDRMGSRRLGLNLARGRRNAGMFFSCILRADMAEARDLATAPFPP